MSRKFHEHERSRETRELMHDVRTQAELTHDQVAERISDTMGYHFTGPQYFAIERGITKDVPLWAVIGFMISMDLASADEIFPYVGRAW